jgi:alkanesulfonate monooxygenase SsuD/methylene tetrahydromethanopterin reductase-like flavin-dependent oxidoreductase (luciferase family)
VKFGIFYEHQLPRPWTETRNDRVLMEEALAQVETADRLGFDYVWEVEHHFLEEYSHSSAPEVFLAAASQRSKQIRLGHGIVNMLPGVNHPARVAERIATLDLVSNGRVDFGTGESSSRIEIEGFAVDAADKRAMWTEALRECARMMTTDPYPGYDGKYFRMPCRNVMPKPLQKPHPPVWVACSNRDTIHLAARLGLGALTFAFTDPAEARHWVDDYYTTLKNECVPLTEVINPNIAMVTSFSVHEDAAEAEARGREGFQFFNYALAHYYIYGTHVPGSTDIWGQFEKVNFDIAISQGAFGGIGTPETVAKHCRLFEDSGVDQVVFIQQGGRNRHEHIVDALELFADCVMPQFKVRHAARETKKTEELAPYIERAFTRKREAAPKAPAPEPRPVPSYGKSVAEGGRGIGAENKIL